jgi:hypothetical protein
MMDGFSLSKDLLGRSRGNEYVSGDAPGVVLMKVNLWGAVNRPGIHFVPIHTDLLTLLSYAGGPTDAAELDDVAIKRRVGGKEELIEINLEKSIRKVESGFVALESNDIVVIPANRPFISQNALATLGFISSLLSVVLVGFLVSDKLK